MTELEPTRTQYLELEKLGRGAFHPDAVRIVSGADMRDILSGGADPNPRLMRPEIARGVRGMGLFVGETG